MKKTRCALVALFMVMCGFSPSEGGEQTYYSIHLASFQSLENTNKYVNSLQNKGKLVFWKQTNVPGKGKFYRVYLGRYAKRSDAVEFWEKLKAEGAVSYFGVHAFKEKILASPSMGAEAMEWPGSGVARPARGTLDRYGNTRLPTESSGPRFVDNGDGTITDTETNLMWIKNGWRLDFFSAVNWWEANKKCERFDAAGYSDWRMPSIQEWQTLIDPANQYPALIEPSPFENMIAHMPYWSGTDFVYSKSRTGPADRRLHVYIVMLYSGSINHQNKYKKAFILPVRTIRDNRH